MPWELIYTSAQKGLIPGQAGYCTVARSRGLRDLLAQRLEQISIYSNDLSKQEILTYRIIELRGTFYYILTRFCDAGLDFTGRGIFLAHHLVFGSEDIAQASSPGAIFLFWSGWRLQWNEPPQILEDLPAKAFQLEQARTLIDQKEWRRLTGEPAGLALAELPQVFAGQLPESVAALNLIAESQEAIREAYGAEKCWQCTFTTFLMPGCNARDFKWVFNAGSEFPLTSLSSLKQPLRRSRTSPQDGLDSLPKANKPSASLKITRANVESKIAPPSESSDSPISLAKKNSNFSRNLLAAFVVILFLLAAIGWYLRPGQNEKLEPEDQVVTIKEKVLEPPPETPTVINHEQPAKKTIASRNLIPVTQSLVIFFDREEELSVPASLLTHFSSYLEFATNATLEPRRLVPAKCFVRFAGESGLANVFFNSHPKTFDFELHSKVVFKLNLATWFQDKQEIRISYPSSDGETLYCDLSGVHEDNYQLQLVLIPQHRHARLRREHLRYPSGTGTKVSLRNLEIFPSDNLRLRPIMAGMPFASHLLEYDARIPAQYFSNEIYQASNAFIMQEKEVQRLQISALQQSNYLANNGAEYSNKIAFAKAKAEKNIKRPVPGNWSFQDLIKALPSGETDLINYLKLLDRWQSDVAELPGKQNGLEKHNATLGELRGLSKQTEIPLSDWQFSIDRGTGQKIELIEVSNP